MGTRMHAAEAAFSGAFRSLTGCSTLLTEPEPKLMTSVALLVVSTRG
jgi:hypothetical protein